jgi:hypothetical protein
MDAKMTTNGTDQQPAAVEAFVPPPVPGFVTDAVDKAAASIANMCDELEHGLDAIQRLVDETRMKISNIRAEDHADNARKAKYASEAVEVMARLDKLTNGIATIVSQAPRPGNGAAQ